MMNLYLEIAVRIEILHTVSSLSLNHFKTCAINLEIVCHYVVHLNQPLRILVIAGMNLTNIL